MSDAESETMMIQAERPLKNERGALGACDPSVLPDETEVADRVEDAGGVRPDAVEFSTIGQPLVELHYLTGRGPGHETDFFDDLQMGVKTIGHKQRTTVRGEDRVTATFNVVHVYASDVLTNHEISQVLAK